MCVASKGDDHHEQVTGSRGDHGALGVAGRTAKGAEAIREDRQVSDIDHFLADALVGFPFATGAEGDLTLDASSIVGTQR